MRSSGAREVGLRKGPENEDSPGLAILARNLTKRFGDTVAVDGIDLDIARGEFFGVLGPNGAGKTSTMRMLGCIAIPGGGELSVLGMDPRVDESRIRLRLGVVPQANHLDQDLTVKENLTTYGRYFSLSRQQAGRRADELLEFAQLQDRAGGPVDALSGGMQRRLAIVRALVNHPDLLLLDEPTTGLDPQARHLLWERLFQLREQGVTLVLTTHYMDEAEQLCDRLVIMDSGRIVAEGSPRALISEHASPHVVELRFGSASAGDFAGKLDGACDRMDVLADRLVLYTEDGDATMAEIERRGLSPASVLNRRSTLEDVFLRLTGRELVE